MKLLLTAATIAEVQDTVEWLRHIAPANETAHTVSTAITGVGMLATAYALMAEIRTSRPDMIIQAGVAGSFSPDFAPGSVALIGDECCGDCGAAENDSFSDVFDLGLSDPNAPPFRAAKLINPTREAWAFSLPIVSGITVNEITTAPARINLLRAKYNPVLESMEGAALHYICLQENIAFLQLRAVSNFVGERNKLNWKLREAIGNLNEKLTMIIQNLS